MNDIILEDMEYIIKYIDVEMFKGNTFLITGANGLLGRYMVELLMYINNNILDEDYCKIFALSRNEIDLKKKFSKYIDKKYFEIIIQNVEDDIYIDDKIDYIIHAASQANTKSFKIDPVGTLSANTIGTFNLLNFAKRKKIKSFLFFSSGAVYGDISCATEPVKENQYYSLNPLNTNSCYAEGKKMGENMCYCFYKQFGIPTKIVRIGHTYGPGINLYDGRVFSDFVRNIINDENLIIRSNGKAKRPFCYISDAIVAFNLVLFKGNSGEAYNVVNNNCYVSINELADILVNKIFKEKKLKIISKDMNQATNKSNNLGLTVLDSNKINKLGWIPKISIDEGFKRTVESFYNNYRK
ncbi:NAD-dependent epimerase/dehydratase family protein [Vallitalea maricola]|uniref:NAD-dependent epimerase/dehydratase family protein n=1 Tax=Vallitalea maricola TaxID=3074433 RepID=A0ACB5UKB4_9FIRM|nr:NAD-dependent epimerase/dehydratase family protein [Vallitalea sp. AN17-2]